MFHSSKYPIYLFPLISSHLLVSTNYLQTSTEISPHQPNQNPRTPLVQHCRLAVTCLPPGGVSGLENKPVSVMPAHFTMHSFLASLVHSLSSWYKKSNNAVLQFNTNYIQQ